VVPVLSESPGTIRSAGSARPGQHNTEIYADLLGLPTVEIAELESQGVL
jgi:formyl-CoA transferase